jgi:acetyl/propionyl-CoA carboxylase alpha subunit
VILEISTDNHRLSVEIAETAGVRRVTVDGEEVPYDWVLLPDGHCSLILGGFVYDFIIDFSGETCSVVGREGSYTLRVADARRLIHQREVEEGQAGLQRLTADMPGKVVRVLVKDGDSVAYDQGLLVLEAMKMQNEIRAPKSGTIREIGVTPGKTVNTGDFLLSLE